MLKRLLRSLAGGSPAPAADSDAHEAATAALAHGRAAAAGNDLDAARRALAQALALDPDLDAARAEAAEVARRAGRLDEAITHCRRLVERHPRSPKLHASLGALLADRGDLDAAIDALRTACELAPDAVPAREQLSRALFGARRFDAAERVERELLEREPDAVRVHLRLAHALLMQGRLDEGWEEYDWRLRLPGFHTGGLRSLPRWDGSDPAGRTLLVVSEQGLGDAMLFARFVPELLRRGARVRLRCRPQLERLFRSSFADARVEITSREDDRAGADAYVHLLGLPRALGLGASACARRAGYLRPDPALAETWRRRLAAHRRPCIGIAWAGNPERSGDDSRSLAPATVAPLAAARPDATWVCLQAGLAPSDPRPFAMEDPMGAVADYADTAAIIAALDLVIAVDTSVAHAAAALGAPLWLLAPHNVCWRWTMGDTPSPWYPGVSLFQAQRPGEWRPVIEAAASALRALPAADA